MQTFHGVGASEGIAIGPVSIVPLRSAKWPRNHLDKEQIEKEVKRFLIAIDSCAADLETLKKEVTPRSKEHASIVDAHQLILRDEHLVDATVKKIRDDSKNCEWALHDTIQDLKKGFEGAKDERFRQRADDVEFVGERVLDKCTGHTPPFKLKAHSIVVADDLSPSDALLSHPEKLLGLVTQSGGTTSHTAIVARHHGLPSVVGAGAILTKVKDDDVMIVDGTSGELFVNPSVELIESYKKKQELLRNQRVKKPTTMDEILKTVDGVVVKLFANAGETKDVSPLLAKGIGGIGLLRSELAFLRHSETPTEEEHYELARTCLEQMGKKPVTIRTLDIGSDKRPLFLNEEFEESNPALGLRSLRFCMDDRFQKFFVSQLRGLLRASVHGKLRILLPMVSGALELKSVLELIKRTQNDLRNEGLTFDENVPLGAMIETPSAVWNVQDILPWVDFISLGCNDLIQYTMAADRGNASVGAYYDSFNPAVIRSLHHVCHVAQSAGKPVSVCGEMASEVIALPLFLAWGVGAFSMVESALPSVAAAVKQLNVKDCQKILKDVLKSDSSQEIRAKLASFLNSSMPVD